MTEESRIGYCLVQQHLPRVIGGRLKSQWLNLKSESLLEHFGLNRQPFNLTPDPGFLYLSASHQQALARILYGIDARKGFIVLTGEVGTGKTTLIHALVKELEKRENQSTLIFNAVSQSKELLRDVCEDLGFTAFQENRHNIHTYLRLLNQLLLESYRRGKKVTLIVDEAQSVSPRVLESIRLMSNCETSEDKLLQIVMAGQPELAVRLNLPILRQLKQRVVLYYHLKPLVYSECADYIAKRLEVAGGSLSIFTSEALQTIYACSGGVPRLINILCDNSMLAAFAAGEKRVHSRIVREVADERSLASAAEEAARAKGVLPRRRVELQAAAADPPGRGDAVEDQPIVPADESPVIAEEHAPDRLTALIERLQEQRHLRIFPDLPPDVVADRDDGETNGRHDLSATEIAISPPIPAEPDDEKRLDTEAVGGASPEAENMPAVGAERGEIEGETQAAAAEPCRPGASPAGEKTSRAVDDRSEILSIDFLEEMIGALTEAMGPMASMVVWDQVSALGEKFDSFPNARLAELVESASLEILEEPLRIRFQQIMSAGMKE